MPYTCPHGYSWERADTVQDRASAQPGACPICTGEPATIGLRTPRPEADGDSDHIKTRSESDTQAIPAANMPSVSGYEILGTLGRGGMGVVYKARHLRLGRLVALKMVLAGAHASPQDLARFRTEAQAAAHVQHPNIVQIYEVGEWPAAEGSPPLPYLALEFVDGPSLVQRFAGTPQSPRIAAQLVETLARAIHHAHLKGVVHRDLKPGNVLLTSDGVPKITDFGLAKQLKGEAAQTQSGAVLGTPAYMAPEQAKGQSRAISPQTDVYALGAILYELVTGRPPFRADTPYDTIMKVISEEPVPPRRLQLGVPRDLETICLKCLHKDPARRYASAEALADDLQRFLCDQPIHARPAGAFERGWRWCRRNPGKAGLAASILILLTVITVGALISAALLADERNAAVAARDQAEAARRDAVEKLWQSYLAQARAGRWSRQPGQRFDSLEAVARAAAIRPSLELRNEAIACLALADLQPTREWELGPGEGLVAVDPQGQRLAASDSKGPIIIRDCRTGRELLRLTQPDAILTVSCFSPNGRYLAVKNDKNNSAVFLWDLEAPEKPLRLPGGVADVALDFSPKSDLLAVGFGGGIRLHDVRTGEVLKRFQGMPVPYALDFHPTEPLLAASSRQGGVIYVWDLTTGISVRQLRPAGVPRGVAWSPDGRILAAGSGNFSIYLWEKGRDLPYANLRGHQAEVTRVTFSRDGRQLLSGGWDGTTRLWDPFTRELVVTIRGDGIVCLPGNQVAYTLGSRFGIWQGSEVAESRVLYDFHGSAKGPWGADVSPDGHILAVCSSSGVTLSSLHDGSELAHLDTDHTLSALFHPEGKSLVTSGTTGLRRWPIRYEEGKDHTIVHIGPPQVLVSGVFERCCFSGDGKVLLAADRGLGRVVVLNWEKPENRFHLEGIPKAAHVAISPDGKWIAAGTWQGTGVRVWSIDGKAAANLPVLSSASVAFSPDGKWLAACNPRETRLFRVGTWERGRALPQDPFDVPGLLRFAPPDGRLLAMAHAHGVVRLVEPESNTEYARLPARDVLGFSRDGSMLVTGIESQTVQVWDLRLIRQRLREMELDWDLPALPAAKRGGPMVGRLTP